MVSGSRRSVIFWANSSRLPDDTLIIVIAKVQLWRVSLSHEQQAAAAAAKAAAADDDWFNFQITMFL